MGCLEELAAALAALLAALLRADETPIQLELVEEEEHELLAVLRRTAAATPPAIVMVVVCGEWGESRCSGVRLPSESSLGKEEGGVRGRP